MRTLREVPNEDHRKELADWARSEFKKNKHEKDEVNVTEKSKQYIATERKYGRRLLRLCFNQAGGL